MRAEPESRLFESLGKLLGRCCWAAIERLLALGFLAQLVLIAFILRFGGVLLPPGILNVFADGVSAQRLQVNANGAIECHELLVTRIFPDGGGVTLLVDRARLQIAFDGEMTLLIADLGIGGLAGAKSPEVVLAQKIYGTLRWHGGWLDVKALSGQLGGVQTFVAGELGPRDFEQIMGVGSVESASSDEGTDERTGGWETLVSTLVEAGRYIRGGCAELRLRPGRGCQLAFTADAVETGSFRAESLSLDGEVGWNGHGKALVSALSAVYDYSLVDSRGLVVGSVPISAGSIDVALEFREQWESELVLSDVDLGGAHIESFQGEAFDLGAGLRFASTLVQGGDVFEISGGLDNGVAELVAQGRLDLENVRASALLSHLPRLPELRFEGMVDVSISAASPWPVQGVHGFETEFEVETDGVSGFGVVVKHAKAEGRVVSGELDLEVLSLESEYSVTSGHYWHDLETGDYRLRAIGRIRPTDLNELIPDEWWHSLWERFQWNAEPPWADLDLFGQYGGGRARKWMLMRVEGQDFAYQGAEFDTVEGTVYLLPEDLMLLGFNAANANGRAEVDIAFRTPLDVDGHRSISVDGASSLTLNDLVALVGENASVATEIFTESRSPWIEGSALYFGEASDREGDLFLNTWVEFTRPVLLKGLFFETLGFHMLNTPDRVELKSVKGNIGGGELLSSGEIFKRDDGRLDFRAAVDLIGAEHLALVAAIEGTRVEPSGRPEGDRYAGLIDLRGDIAGELGRIDTLIGSGHVRLRDADLARIRVFGGLSDALKALGIPLGTLAVDGGSSDLQLARGYLSFPNVVLTGPTIRIDAVGYIDLLEETMRFNAAAALFGSVTQPLLSQILNSIGVLSGAVALRLEGSIEDPRWSLFFRPEGIVSRLEPLTPPERREP